MWVHFTIEESYILGNTIFDLVKMETVRPVDKFICLLIMFLSNLNVTSVPHFLPRKYIFDIYTVCYRIQSFILFENKCIIRKRRYNFTLDETGAYYTEHTSNKYFEMQVKHLWNNIWGIKSNNTLYP